MTEEREMLQQIGYDCEEIADWCEDFYTGDYHADVKAGDMLQSIRRMIVGLHHRCTLYLKDTEE